MLLILLGIFLNIDSLDAEVLFWIHEHLHSGWGNEIFPYFRIPLFWLPLYIILAGFFVYWWRKKFWIPLLFLAGTVGITDYVSVHAFKKQVERPRPCHTYEKDGRLELLIPCGGKFGFVSTHAANHMAMAAFLILLFRNTSPGRRWWWLFWAFLVGFSQVYVGVHYPFDVLCGFIFGGIMGFTTSYIMKKYFPYFFITLPSKLS